MTWLWLALLACAVLVLLGAEWPRLESRLGRQGRAGRSRARRKSRLQVVTNDDVDDFAASVERDLALLPTIEEREEDGRGRR